MLEPLRQADIPLKQRTPIFINEAKIFNTNSPYKANLLRCAQSSFRSPCSLGELPLLGQQTQNPSIQNVMDRVVITHDWTGYRFQQILERLPRQVLQLFKPAAIVYIGSDTEFTHFEFDRAIFNINIDEIWVNATEKKAVLVGDERLATFTETGLRFEPRFRWMKDSVNAYSGLFGTERDAEQMLLLLGRSIYYDLALPNNRLSGERFNALEDTQLPLDVLAFDASTAISTELYSNASLTTDSSNLYLLADVQYGSEEISASLSSEFRAAGVGAEIAAQGKPRFFSFTAKENDLATLFELAMVKMVHRVYLDVALVDAFDGPAILGCDDYKIGWGVRNRIAAPRVSARAKFVVESLIGQSDETDAFFASQLGVQTGLPPGVGWCDSIDDLPGLP